MKYYITDPNDEVQGPFDLEEITNFLAAGSIEKASLCCEEGSEKWGPLESIQPPPPAAVPAVKSEKPSKKQTPAPATQKSSAPPPAAVPAVAAKAPVQPQPKSAQPVEPARLAKAQASPAPAKSGNSAILIGIIVTLAAVVLVAYWIGTRL